MTESLRSLHVFRDAPLDGPTNMARDEQLMHSDAHRPAALRVYSWAEPTISLGYFQRYQQLEELPRNMRGLPVVRRTTGGGAILHDREVTYCLVLDDSVPIARSGPAALYALVHTCWKRVLESDGFATELTPDSVPLPSPRSGPFFCFEKPGRTDLLIGEDKLLGSAQRRIPGRVMQHGSLLLAQRFKQHPGATLGDPSAVTVDRWIDGFVRLVAEALDLAVAHDCWSQAVLEDVAQRRVRYASDEWTHKR